MTIEMTDELDTAIETLRADALAHGELAAVHLCTAALGGEEWAVERVAAAVARLADRPRGFAAEDWNAQVVADLARDSERPDGAVAKRIEL